jgi:hypothetical protein
VAAFATGLPSGDFSGENPETSAYPSTDSVVARFGTVSVPTHRQALAGLSWLSFSPPAVSAGRRAWSRPVARIAADELPTAARVERGDSSKSRTPNPPRRITRRTGASLPFTASPLQIRQLRPSPEGPCLSVSRSPRFTARKRAGRIACSIG